jgi:DNA-binding NarL/FixJ family response regulator
MAKLLLITSDPSEAVCLTQALTDKPEWEVLQVTSPQDIREQVDAGIDLVLADTAAFHGAGSQEIASIREKHPRLPILLVAAESDRQSTLKALVLGAASFIPRGRAARELPQTIARLLAISGREHSRRLSECLRASRQELTIGNDPRLIPVVVTHLQDNAAMHNICDQRELIQVGVALDEALINALVHGNLEISSELREQEGAYEEQIQQRLSEPPYCHRSVFVSGEFTPAAARFVIRDEGPGFDPTQLPDPTDPENLLRPYGRGVLLMRAFMHDVAYNARGNEVTLTRFADASDKSN